MEAEQEGGVRTDVVPTNEILPGAGKDRVAVTKMWPFIRARTVPSSARRRAPPRAAVGPLAIWVPGHASMACGPGPRGLLSVY